MSGLRNWAGNVVYRAEAVHHPASVAELRAVVAGHARVRALGTRHSFSELADTTGQLVCLDALPRTVEIDSSARTARVSAALSYADIAPELERAGFALPNLASLPHVSVAGACATGTHGSGVRNATLSAQVSALDLVTADGDLVTVNRDAAGELFDGMVVGLGALGIVVALTLDLVPSFRMRQRVYEELPLAAFDGADHRFDELVSAAYSVCLFTDLSGPTLNQVWINQRTDEPACDPRQWPWFTARPAPGPRHPIARLSAANCTAQLDMPGPWFDRLPHFRADFQPSAGDELQSEYMIPREHAVAALRALDQARDGIRPALQICELRTVAPDGLWLSPCHGRDSVSVHFTWISDASVVLPVVALVEELLAPFDPRPHWAKVFTTAPGVLAGRYPKLADFHRLALSYDPGGKFGNDFLDRCLGLRTPTPVSR
ncbi:MAG TPA: D-arabinono-1,4-lactone oxidase [Pseudonocardiaceae bacterium]|jgi:xylitol oxidase